MHTFVKRQTSLTWSQLSYLQYSLFLFLRNYAVVYNHAIMFPSLGIHTFLISSDAVLTRYISKSNTMYRILFRNLSKYMIFL